ncbi:MAG: beta-phosphoglucomutase [Candidatus Ornithospirochaeta sp.]
MVEIKAVIFDLDGVLCFTDKYHLEAWTRLAKAHGLSLPPDFTLLTKGVGRRESLDILLGSESNNYTESEKEEMAREKNAIYCSLIDSMSSSDLAPGALDVLKYLQEKGIKIALGSSSRNAQTIIMKLGIEKEFDVIVDGTLINKGKPDPEVFVEAAKLLKVPNNVSLVVEDSIAGIIAARRGGFMTSFISSLPMPGDVMIYVQSLSALKDEIEKRMNT